MLGTSLKFQNFSLLVLRFVIAAIFLFAAYAKLAFWSAAPPGISPVMLNLIKFLSIVEPLGAIALILGIFTRLAATGLGMIMIGAIVILYFTMVVGFFTQPQAIGLDYNFLIFAGCLILMAFGAGKISIDASRKER
jgi:putative oxidoreductase